MAESTLGLHLELPASVSVAPAEAREYGAIQLIRALYRPIVDPGGDYALADASHDDGALVLTVRDDARWNQSEAVVVEELRGAVEAMARRAPGLAALLGIDPAVPRDPGDGPRTLRVRSRAPRLLGRVLGDVRFTPSARRRFTGAFVPVDDRLLRPACARGKGPALSPVVVGESRAAVEAFDRREIVATCPGMFDVDGVAGDRPLASCVSDLTMCVRIHPSLDASRFALAHAAGAALARLASGDPPATRAIERDDWPAREPHAAPAPRPEGPLTLLYGTYWPNAEVAAAVRDELVAAGHRVVLEGVPLDALTRRIENLDFDLSLAIHAGQWGSDSLLLAFLASLCAAVPADDDAELDRLVRRLDDGAADARSALRGRLLAALPILPLFRFRSSFLAAGPLRDLPLASGSVLRLESLIEC